MDILIGSLIRDREWILPKFLKHIYNLNYEKKSLTLFFILNDSEDNSKEILEKFKKDFEKEYKEIIIEEINLGTPKDSRVGSRKKVYKSLAILRNKLLEKGKNFSYFYSIDSDILINSEDLNNLLKTNKDIISGIIDNGGVPNLMKYNEQLCLVHYRNWYQEKKDIFEVDLTGAVYLISKKVCEKVKYEYFPRGEDFGFCWNALFLKFKLYAHKGVQPQHVMIKEQLKCQLQKI